MLIVWGSIGAQVKANRLSLCFFDSVLLYKGTALVDLGFPASVNRIKGSKTTKYIRSDIGSYKLYSYKSINKVLKRDKVIFNTNDDRNFQFFYLGWKGYYIGSGYYAYGKRIDDMDDDSIPYMPSRLDAYSVFSDVNNKYVIVYDKMDATEVIPKMSNSIRIYLLDVNYLPKKILFYSSERGCFLYQFKSNKFFKLRDAVDFYNADFAYLFDVNNYDVDSMSKLRTTKDGPLFNLYMK